MCLRPAVFKVYYNNSKLSWSVRHNGWDLTCVWVLACIKTWGLGVNEGCNHKKKFLVWLKRVIKRAASPLANIPIVCSESMNKVHTQAAQHTQKQLCNAEAHTEGRGRAVFRALTQLLIICLCMDMLHRAWSSLTNILMYASPCHTAGGWGWSCSGTGALISSDFSTAAPFPPSSCSASLPTSTFLSPAFPMTVLQHSEMTHERNYWRGDFLFKTRTLRACATMYDNAYEGDDYAVGTLWRVT